MFFITLNFFTIFGFAKKNDNKIHFINISINQYN